MSTETPKTESVSNDPAPKKAPPYIQASRHRNGVLIFSHKDRQGFFRVQSRSKYTPGVEDGKHRRARETTGSTTPQPGEEPRKQAHA